MSSTTNHVVIDIYVFRSVVSFGPNPVWWQIHIRIVLLPNHAAYPHAVNDYAVPPQRPSIPVPEVDLSLEEDFRRNMLLGGPADLDDDGYWWSSMALYGFSLWLMIG
jgi:hypothetical protein